MDHSIAVAADKSSLGFDYQDLVYIEKLIALEKGQILGLELHDDIHMETADGDGSIKDLHLIQVKHSTEGGNITDRDIDLWKTFYNWLKIVPGLPPSQNLMFRLYTNKPLNNQPFITMLKAAGEKVSDIIAHVRATDADISASESKKAEGASANPLAKYVKSVAQANDKDLTLMFERFEFNSDPTSILDRINDALRKLLVPDTSLDETIAGIVGAFKLSKFSRIKSGEKVVISYDDFHLGMGYDRVIRAARSDDADFERFVDFYYAYQRPDGLSFASSKFHAQLEDIGIDGDVIIDHGIEMMLAETFITKLNDEGTFSQSDNLRLENRAVADWTHLHRSSHRHTDEADEGSHQQAAQNCFYEAMGKALLAGRIELPSNLSRGKYIKLSDLPRIGWRKNWESKFK